MKFIPAALSMMIRLGLLHQVTVGTSTAMSAPGTSHGVGVAHGSRKLQNAVWEQFGPTIGSEEPDEVGYSVALSANGDILAVGATGYDNSTGLVQVFENINSTWIQLGNNLVANATESYFGLSIALSATGNIVAVGAPGPDGVSGFQANEDGQLGYVLVYEYDDVNNVWKQFGNKIVGEAINDAFGCSVSLSQDGEILAVGAKFNSPSNMKTEAGHVRVYRKNFNTNVWDQIGADIDGKADGDNFGTSVSLSLVGDLLAIGAPYNNDTGLAAGLVQVYEIFKNSWSQRGSDLHGLFQQGHFGESLSLSGDGSILAVGAPFVDLSAQLESVGQVVVYQFNNSAWTQLGTSISGVATADFVGSSVSLSSNGNVLATGLVRSDIERSDKGQVQVYRLTGNVWAQIGGNITGDYLRDYFGNSVSLSYNGTMVAVGASNATGSGEARVFKLSGPTLAPSMAPIGQTPQPTNLPTSSPTSLPTSSPTPLPTAKPLDSITEKPTGSSKAGKITKSAKTIEM